MFQILHSKHLRRQGEIKLKKHSMTYIVALLMIGLIAGFGVAFFLIRQFHTGFMVAGVIFTVIAEVILFTFVKGIVWSTNVKKLERSFSDSNFEPDATFESTVGKIYIDRHHNSIGVISKLNPFRFQTVNASQIQNACVDDGKMLGGTRLVCFCFHVDGVVWKVPTLTANTTLSMEHPKVVKALQTASDYCDIITHAK